jgi:hypothetical protein
MSMEASRIRLSLLETNPLCLFQGHGHILTPRSKPSKLTMALFPSLQRCGKPAVVVIVPEDEGEERTRLVVAIHVHHQANTHHL